MDEFGAPNLFELGLLELGPENEEQLARLRRALILGAGFQIVSLEVSHPSLAKEVLRRLHAWSGHDGVPPLKIVQTRPGRDPVASLQHLTAGAVLVGIDRSLDSAGIGHGFGLGFKLGTIDDSGPDVHADVPVEKRVEQTMTTLNWYRDLLPALVKGPLVLVLSPDGLRQMFVHAPDLLAWRAHSTRVTLPRPTALEIRPRPSRCAALEEKAWLEKMIGSIASNDRGPLARELPRWLIRLGEIEAREGGPWQQRFERAEALAAERPEILCKIELARARHALDEARHEDAKAHLDKAVKHLSSSPNTDGAPESMLVTLWKGLVTHELGARVALIEIMLLLAEHQLRLGHAAQAATLAAHALRPARASGDLALMITALSVAGAVASHRGNTVDARLHFHEMQAAAHAAEDGAAELFAVTRLLELAPDVTSARRLYLQAVSIMKDADHEAHAHVCLELSLLELSGDPAEAERVLSQITIAELKPAMKLRVLVARGDAAKAQDQREVALASYRSAWNDPQRALLPPWEQVGIAARLGATALDAGDVEIARDVFQRFAEIAKVLASRELVELARLGLELAGRAAEGTGEPA